MTAAGDGCYDALQLHGHGAQNGGYKVFDPASGAVSISPAMRKYAKLYDGDASGEHTVFYRFSTGNLRLERIIDEPLLLEGATTTRYVRPEWWGGTPGDGDATDAIAWALEAAEARAEATSNEHFVVLSGMYGYSTVIETQQGAVLKGEVDDQREGQGLYLLPGAAWHYFAVKDWVSDPAYREPLTERDGLLKNADPKVHIRHGRQATLARVVDLEINGNLEDNGIIYSSEYEQASGPAGNPIWPNRVLEMTRNTSHFNGFLGADNGDTLPNSNARLKNVAVIGFGGNGILSNDWTHFGGSRDLRIGDIVNNHPMYGVPTGDGWIDGIELTGFFWKAAISVYSGNYRNVTYLACEENPYGDPLESIFDIRNDSPGPADIGQGGKHHFGETVTVEGFTAVFTNDCRPKTGFGTIEYTRGPTTFRDVSLTVETDRVALVGHRWAPDDGSEFVLEDVTVAGAVTGLSGIGAGRQHIQSVTSSPSPIDGGEMFVFRPQPGVSQVVTVYDVDLNARSQRLFKVWPSGESAGTSVDLFVRDSEFDSALPVQFVDAPADTRIYYRRTTLSDWKNDILADGHEWFDDVTVLEHGGRTSDESGTESFTAQGGETFIDLRPGLFHAPTAPSFVDVSNVRVNGASAPALITGDWTAVGQMYDPVLRLELGRPLTVGETVTFDWSAAVRPIPASVVFPVAP